MNLASNLRDDGVIYRRSSVIDAGDAGDQSLLPYIPKYPYLCHFELKVLKITPKLMTKNQRALIIQLLQDDPRKLDYIHNFRTLEHYQIFAICLCIGMKSGNILAKHLINMPSNDILEHLHSFGESRL